MMKMPVLYEKIHELRRNPAICNGKVVKGPFSPDPVELVNIIIQNESFYLFYRSLRNPNEINSKIFFEDQLRAIEVIEQDFGGNATIFYLSVMGYIIKNNYQTDPYFAVGISNIDPLPHQLDAVYNYILPRGRLRFMIADDPGAGKTIMAGLVIKEYQARGLAKRILIISPGGLVEQWDNELTQKFGEHFTIVHRGLFSSFGRQNIWEEHSKVISSMDFLKQADIMKSLEKVTWDLVIVDEAHKFSGQVIKELFEPNDRYKLGKLVCGQALNLLFLTATPHKGDLQVYRMLLALLEPEIFGDEFVYYAPDVNQQVIELEKAGFPIFLRRLKESMVDLKGNSIFKKRRSDTITWTISELETKLYRAVSKYVTENFNKALKDRKTAVAFALKIMQRRLLSSSHAIFNTLKNRADRLQEILDNQDYNTSKDDLAKMEQDFRTKLELEWDDLSEHERNKIEQKLLQLSMAKNPKELKEEIDLLRSLQDFAEELMDRPDQETKLWEMKKLLETHLKDPTEKILIFTEFTDTLTFLEKWIADWGYSTCIIHGGMDQAQRKDARKDFEKNKQVCIATEAAGEGINLQFCHLLINYDIPWVPTRLEQRLGRIHRYGQPKDCYFMNLVSDKAADGKPIVEGDVLASLLRKIETIQESLGEDRVFDVIGEEMFEDLSLDQAFMKIINDPNGFFEIKKRIDSDELREKIKKTLEIARANMLVNLESIRAQSKLSEDARLWPEYIEEFVRKALDHLHGKLTSTNTISVPKELQEFSSAVASKYENVTFFKPEPTIFEKNPAEYITVGHPLLDGLAEFYQTQSEIDLRRGAIFIDEQDYGAGLLWFVEQPIADGTNRITGKRIGGVFQAFDKNLNPQDPRLIPQLKLCDFKPNEGSLEIRLPIDLTKEQNRILAFFQDTEGKAYYTQIKNANDGFCEIQEQSTKKAHDHQRGYLVQLISSIRNQLKTPNLEDKKKEVLERRRTRAENQREVLQKRYDKFQTELNLRRSINPLQPRVIGIALVMPSDLAGRYDPEFLLLQEKREKKLRELIDKRKVEKIAMDLVMEYEEKHCGRKPVRVDNVNCGYDIESVDSGDSAKTRRIEVKGHTETADTFISNNEFKMGLRYGDNYWLYIVEYALSKPRLRPIQNPALKFFEDAKGIQRTTFKISKETINEKCEIVKL